MLKSQNKIALYLTSLFAVAVIGTQIILVNALPHMGMGSLGNYYIVWPLLAIWIVALFFVLERMKKGAGLLTLICIVAMVVVSVLVFPQDTPRTFWEKIELLRDWG